MSLIIWDFLQLEDSNKVGKVLSIQAPFLRQKRCDFLDQENNQCH